MSIQVSTRGGVAMFALPGVPDGLDPGPVVDQMLRRASSLGFDTWWRRAANARFCAAPIQLAGTDRFGRDRRVWVRCNNRRASVCASCSDLYARDTWQLVHAGLHGGHHRMPSSIAEHPQVFLTLTAPGFGPVHTTRSDRNGKHSGACRYRGRLDYRRCQHGKPLWCSLIHGDDDPRVGQPLCDECYDYTGHVLFAWHAPELWRRFTIALRRLVDSHLRTIGEATTSVRVNYVKVTEMQRRAVPHFHAVIRLDGPPAPGEPPRAPASSVAATDLAMLVQRAARAVTLTVSDPDNPGGDGRVLRFGAQTDTQALQPTNHTEPDAPPRYSGLVDRLPVSKVPMQTFTTVEVEKLLDTFAEDRLGHVWQLALVGLRRGELCGLRWTDIDFEAQRISIEITRVVVDGKVVEGDTKSETSTRVLPLTPELVAALRAATACRPRSSSPPGPPTSAAATSSSTLWGGATTRTRCPTSGPPRVRRRA